MLSARCALGVAMNAQIQELPVQLTVVEGGLSANQNPELPYDFNLKNLVKALIEEIDQMTPSNR